MKKILFFLLSFTYHLTASLILNDGININSIFSTFPNQNGILNQTFGNNNTGVPGTTVLSQIIPGFTDVLHDILIDNTMIIACGRSNDYFSIARFTSSGLPDTGFGNNGTNYVHFKIGNPNAPENTAYAVIKDSTGYILGGRVSDGSTRTYGIAKFTKQGFLDLPFGGHGNGTNFINSTIIAGHSFMSKMIKNPITDTIIAVGYTIHNNNNYYFSLAQFLPSGILDTFFGGNGTGYTYLPLNIAGGSEDYCYAVGLQSTGNIILAGSSNNTANEPRFAVACYTTNGILNTSFGNNGTAYIPYTIAGGNLDECFALAIQPDDKIILAGVSFGTDTYYHFALARFTSDGKLDTTFGTNGTTFLPSIGNEYTNYAYSVQLQQDEKIIIAGTSETNFAFARLNNDGTLDTTFGNNGTFYFSATNFLSTVSIQLTDDSIIAGGNGNEGPYYCICKLTNIPTTKQFQSIYAGEAGFAA